MIENPQNQKKILKSLGKTVTQLQMFKGLKLTFTQNFDSKCYYRLLLTVALKSVSSGHPNQLFITRLSPQNWQIGESIFQL